MAESYTVNLGSKEDGAKRREAYNKAAAREGITLGSWVKKCLDKASGFKTKE